MRIVLAFLLAIISTTSFAQQAMFTDSPVKCVRLGGMEQLFEVVVNEQQVIPPMSTDVFRGNGDCTYNFRPFTANAREAAAAGVFAGEQLVGFMGWIVTERWLIAVEQIAYLDRAKEKAYRPAAVLRRARWDLPQRCYRLTQTFGDVQIIGHQFDYRGKDWRCGTPILVSN